MVPLVVEPGAAVEKSDAAIVVAVAHCTIACQGVGYGGLGTMAGPGEVAAAHRRVGCDAAADGVKAAMAALAGFPSAPADGDPDTLHVYALAAGLGAMRAVAAGATLEVVPDLLLSLAGHCTVPGCTCDLVDQVKSGARYGGRVCDEHYSGRAFRADDGAGGPTSWRRFC